MKSLLLLWQRVLADASTQCRISANLDTEKRVEARVRNEGLQFFTITLPNFGKAFERSLDLGIVTPATSPFILPKRKTGKAGGLPLLLGEFLELIFDRADGRLLDTPCVDAIQAVRQLTMMYGKVLFPCSKTRDQAAFTQYIECDNQVAEARLDDDCELLRSFRRVSTMLFGEVFSRMDRDVYMGMITPRHGPGATADRLRNNAKYRLAEWTDRLEEIFPAGENILPNWRYHQNLDDVTWLEPGAERPVRVITVPKTMKTPRIIAIEPTCMQYMQQGLMEKIVDYLESDFLVQSMVGFTFQEPNQLMACEGSLTGGLATLDLSEASDRVSMQHVRHLTANFPWLFKALDATRSRRADVPGRGVISLHKYASMGSALTFPIEECIFLCAVFLGIESKLNRHLTRKGIQSFSGRVRVYGDDIIVPVEYATSVVETLELLGFRVNRDKSFWTGRFRESCGKEYYSGHDVSICRVRRMLPSHRRDVPELISAVSLRNQFYKAGYWGSAEYLDQLIGKLIPFPTVGRDSPVLGRHSVLGYESIQGRYHRDYQTPLVRGFVVRSQNPESILDNEGALLKYFLKRGDKPYVDRKHLERQGRPKSVRIKLGLHRPY